MDACPNAQYAYIASLVIKRMGIRYRIAGYFRSEFTFRYFEEAFFFKNKFLVIAFLRKLTASCEDFSVSECVWCNGIRVFSIADSGEHGNFKSFPVLQTSFFTDMASTYYIINCKRHQYAHDSQGDVVHIYTVGRSATTVKQKVNSQFKVNTQATTFL